jgi:hypothetical protein
MSKPPGEQMVSVHQALVGHAHGEPHVYGGGAWRAICPVYANCDICEISSKYERVIHTSSSVSSGKGCE